MPKSCRIEPVYTGSKNSFQFDLLCEDAKGEFGAGIIKAHKTKIAGKTRYVVDNVSVAESLQRKGWGTKLYEAAAAEACRRRAPLASKERTRGAKSIEFWAKQLRKGRAVILSKRSGLEAREKAPVYSLECPAPASLAGRLRRRR